MFRNILAKYSFKKLSKNVTTKLNNIPKNSKRAITLGMFTGTCILGQTYFGSTNNFYDHRFLTTANPDDLADFYGNEDFMEIFCVFPFMVDFMMRSGYFDDDGHVHTFGLPPFISKMVVSMQFDEREENDSIICFNKKDLMYFKLYLLNFFLLVIRETTLLTLPSIAK